jgi:predicted DNA-binding protein
MLTTTISLTYEIHRRLKLLAVDQGVSVRDLIREAIEEYLNRKGK